MFFCRTLNHHRREGACISASASVSSATISKAVLTASTSDTHGAFASISTSDDESSIGGRPSSQPFPVDNGKTVDLLPGASVRLSDLKHFLWVPLHMGNCLNLSKTNVANGRSDGRQAVR